jgi:hypothetical protein
MGRQPRDDVERQVRALELRIGVDHHGDIDRIGDGAKIGFDLGIPEREIRFHDCENAVGAELLIGLGLLDCVHRRGRRDAGNHRHAALGGLDGRLHHRRALRVIEIGELTGRAERRQSVHARFDEIVAEPAEHPGSDIPLGVERRDEIRENAVEIGHDVSASEIRSGHRYVVFQSR